MSQPCLLCHLPVLRSTISFSVNTIAPALTILYITPPSVSFPFSYSPLSYIAIDPLGRQSLRLLRPPDGPTAILRHDVDTWTDEMPRFLGDALVAGAISRLRIRMRARHLGEFLASVGHLGDDSEG